MQAFWWAQTVVASGDSDLALVYHKGRFAYEVQEPTPEFWAAAGGMKLPGQAEWERDLKVRQKFDRRAK